MTVIPDDRTYTRNHVWVKIDAAVVRMGITAPLLDKLGPLVALEIPAPDDAMMLEVIIGTVEGENGIHEISPPADAHILEVNKGLEWDLGTLENDPYGEGWLMKIKVHEPDHLRNLLVPEAYQEYCEETLGEKYDLE
ncbi:MAG: hypothetical protein KGZ25_08980 [Planctomycetes bacterium]|nr:hypothetical protein [Planctomycetota bacterium]